MNDCKCIVLSSASIYMLDQSDNYGYSYSYGQNYGQAAVNQLQKESYGTNLGNAGVKVNIKYNNLDIGYGLSIDKQCASSVIDSVTLEIDTACWSQQNIALATGAQIETIQAQTVTKRIYRSIFQHDALTFDAEVDSFSGLLMPDNKALLVGLDYFLINGQVFFSRNIQLINGQYIEITVNLKPYNVVKVKRSIVKNCGLYIKGINDVNNKTIAMRFHNVLIMPSDVEYTAPNTDSAYEIKLYAKVKRQANDELYDLINFA